MTFVHLTAPSGHKVAIVADQIVSLRQPLPREMSPGTNTVITMTSGIQGVMETIDEVVAKLP